MKGAARGVFHIHLSTAVVLLFCAAALLWLNMGLHSYRLYGWPVNMFSYDFTYYDALAGYHITPTDNNLMRLLLNVLSCLCFLFMVGYTCEKRIRNGARPLNPGTLTGLLVVAAVGLTWNVENPIHYYYRPEGSQIAAVAMRILSLLALLFIYRFIMEELFPRVP